MRAHRAQIVAREVDQHHVLGALLLIGEQFVGDALVGGRIGAARTRSGERPNPRRATVEPHQKLRRRTEHRAAAVLDEEHVRRRVARADLTVEIERGPGERAREPDADLQLVRVAVADERLRLRDARRERASSIDALTGPSARTAPGIARALIQQPRDIPVEPRVDRLRFARSRANPISVTGA